MHSQLCGADGSGYARSHCFFFLREISSARVRVPTSARRGWMETECDWPLGPSRGGRSGQRRTAEASLLIPRPVLSHGKSTAGAGEPRGGCPAIGPDSDPQALERRPPEGPSGSGSASGAVLPLQPLLNPEPSQTVQHSIGAARQSGPTRNASMDRMQTKRRPASHAGGGSPPTQ